MITKEQIIALNRANKLKEYILKGGFVVAEKKKTAKDIEELDSYFTEVDNKYNTDNKASKMESDLNLTKLDNVTKSADEISQLAKDSLKDYYNLNIEKINSDNSNNIETLKNSIATQTENANQLKEKVANNIDEVKQDASNDALKRGLARSSIVINKLNAFDNAKINEYNKIDEELTTAVNKINTEIDGLNLEKEQALKEFDITYAAKLNEQINTLTEELAQKQAEITKYNNEIAQIEAEYEKDKLNFNNDANQQDFKNIMELNEFVAKYGANALNTVKNSEKYDNEIIGIVKKRIEKEERNEEFNWTKDSDIMKTVKIILNENIKDTPITEDCTNNWDEFIAEIENIDLT